MIDVGTPYALVALKNGTRLEYEHGTVDVFDGRTLTVTDERTGDILGKHKPGTWRAAHRFDAQHYQEFFFDASDWRVMGQKQYV